MAANVPSSDMNGDTLQDCKKLVEKLAVTAKGASVVEITDFLGSPIIGIYNAAEITFLDLKNDPEWGEVEVCSFISNLIEYAYFVHAKLRSVLCTFECTITKYEREELVNNLVQDLSLEEVTLSPFRSLLSISEKAVKVYAFQFIELLEKSLALKRDHDLENLNEESFTEKFIQYMAIGYERSEDFQDFKQKFVTDQIIKFGNSNIGSDSERAMALMFTKEISEKGVGARFNIQPKGIYRYKNQMLGRIALQLYGLKKTNS